MCSKHLLKISRNKIFDDDDDVLLRLFFKFLCVRSLPQVLITPLCTLTEVQRRLNLFLPFAYFVESSVEILAQNYGLMAVNLPPLLTSQVNI